MDKPKPEQIIDVEGPSGESVFRRLISWCVPTGASERFQQKIDEEILAHVRELNDDRLLVLVGALIIENAVDELLAAIMPGYRSLRDKRDCSFSMRVEIARALRLIPSRILNCADFIRGLRNDFVHDLSIEKLDKLKPSRIQSMRDRLSAFTSQEFEEEAETFRMLVVWTAVALYGYTMHVARLNDFIRSNEFYASLQAFLDQN